MTMQHDRSSKIRSQVQGGEGEKAGDRTQIHDEGVQHDSVVLSANTKIQRALDPTPTADSIDLFQNTLPRSPRNGEAEDNVMAGKSPVTYGRRDWVPVEERGLLHRILDIPHELRVFFGPVPTYSLTEVRRRVCTMWSINEPQLSEMVNQKLLSHLTAIYDRRRDNKYAFIEPLKRDWKTYVNGSDCIQACLVEIWPKKKGVLVFNCYADDKAGVDARYRGPPSEDATKSFCATLLAFADYVNASGSGTETLLFKCYGRSLEVKGGSQHGLWWSNKVGHQFGLRSGHMKIKLRE